MKKHSVRTLKSKKGKKNISMLTCYDYQTAQLLNESSVDCLLVGDSLGNVILGFDSTIPVTVSHMQIFGQAVKRGASDKFVIVDLPFGSYFDLETGLKNAIQIFQETGADAVKLEGASKIECDLISRLKQIGIPTVAHIGLQPQSVKALGGYFYQGKDKESAEKLLRESLKLEEAGALMIVLECLPSDLAAKITESLSIPTIGIGAGKKTDGQVLVINDLLKDCYNSPPSFCKPITDIFEIKKKAIEEYLKVSEGDYEASPEC